MKMKILLNFFLALLITASAANGQGILKGSRLWLYNNTDSAAVNSTTGIIRYDPVTGKYRFYNALTGTWFTYGSGAGGFSNTAAANEIMKSDGTDAVPSGFFSIGAGVLTTGSGTTPLQFAAGSAGGIGGGYILTSGYGVASGTDVYTGFNYNGSSYGSSVVNARVSNQSTGTIAAGIGVGLEFHSKTEAPSNFEIIGKIDAVTTNVVSTNEYSDLRFFAMGQGALGQVMSISKLAGPTTRITLPSGTIDAAASGTKFNHDLLVNSDLKVGTTVDDTPDRRFHVEEVSASTNTVIYPARFSRDVQSGVGANGVGVGIELETEAASGKVVGTTIESIAADVTSGSEDFDYVVKNMAAGAAASEKFRVTSDGRIYGKALHNNANAITGTTNQYIASGTYTPTLTGTTNVDAVVVQGADWVYMRVGNVVTVSGQINIDATAASTTTSVRVQLPIPSSFSTSNSHCAGTMVHTNTGISGAIRPDATNDDAQINFSPAVTTATSYSLQFTYVIL